MLATTCLQFLIKGQFLAVLSLKETCGVLILLTVHKMCCMLISIIYYFRKLTPLSLCKSFPSVYSLVEHAYPMCIALWGISAHQQQNVEIEHKNRQLSQLFWWAGKISTEKIAICCLCFDFTVDSNCRQSSRRQVASVRILPNTLTGCNSTSSRVAFGTTA